MSLEQQSSKSFFSSLSPKASFIVGLVGGIMALCTVGFFVMLGVMINNGGLSLTSSSSKVAGTATGNSNTNAAAAPSAAPSVNLEVGEDDYIRGNPDAKITLIEYSDYECPYCSRFHESAMQLVAAYPDDVRWVYKHFPLDSLHPQARPAAQAAECAAEQGGNDAFWEYSDALFENQATLGDELFTQLAGDLGLDVNAFTECYDSDTYADKVSADYQEGINAGVRGTPGNFLNGKSLGGAVPYSQLEAEVKALL
ncbi:MAG: DsbA family protein [bacterium]|nr:DsbA family protein [bacterium]